MCLSVLHGEWSVAHGSRGVLLQPGSNPAHSSLHLGAVLTPTTKPWPPLIPLTLLLLYLLPCHLLHRGSGQVPWGGHRERAGGAPLGLQAAAGHRQHGAGRGQVLSTARGT